MSLQALDIVATYGNGRRALDGVSTEVAAGKTLAVVGPSAAGKSTLLRVIAGLMRPQSGDVVVEGRSVVRIPPRDRRVALVFQDDALFSHMTVRANLQFALHARGARNGTARIERTARALHVDATLDRKPRELSGGERQRASVARALLSDPAVLLLDEPLAHLDPALRRSVRDELTGVRELFEGPIVYVTHDHTEAMSVGDRLAVLIEGRIEDAGQPQRVYDAPRSLSVARFLGDPPMNVIEDSTTLLGIRPEHVLVSDRGALRGTILRSECTGADAYLYVGTERGTLCVRVAPNERGNSGEPICLDLPDSRLRRFDRATGLAL